MSHDALHHDPDPLHSVLALISDEQRGPDDEATFQRRLTRQLRSLMAKARDLTHASITRQDPAGRTWTAYGRKEGPADISVWIREGGGEPGEDHERLAYVVAHERHVAAEAARKKTQRKREPDPRIWGPIRDD